MSSQLISCFYIQLILKHNRARAGSVKSQGCVSHTWADTIHFACFGRKLPMSLCAFRNAGVCGRRRARISPFVKSQNFSVVHNLSRPLGAAFSSTSCAERHTEVGVGVVQFDEALRLCPIQGHESIGKNSFSLDLQTYNTKESTLQRNPFCHLIWELQKCQSWKSFEKVLDTVLTLGCMVESSVSKDSRVSYAAYLRQFCSRPTQLWQKRAWKRT